MKIVSINALPHGSTGKIMMNITRIANEEGFSASCYYGAWKKTQKNESFTMQFGFKTENIFSMMFSRLTGIQHCGSVIGTKLLISKLKKHKPDLIHLHNLHLWVINVPKLFNFIKKNNIPVIWTLHDCWSFTGQCPHFTMVKCDKWKTGCYKCPQYRLYPAAYIDCTKTMWKLKRKWFTGVNNLTIVTPSKWLGDLVKQSYLKDYPVKVINNGIDLSIFKPTPSNFREKYNIGNRKIALGIAFDWGVRKGLDVFIELSKRLDPDKYKIVLVGTNEKIDNQLPKGIISIHRTHNQAELAEIYTAADVFVNPTREEVLGLVNIESNACGTPVVTFNTGGSPECIDETSGVVVDCDDIYAMEREIIRICEDKPYTLEACIERANSFDMNEKFGEYIKLYKEIYDKK